MGLTTRRIGRRGLIRLGLGIRTEDGQVWPRLGRPPLHLLCMKGDANYRRHI